MMLLLMMEVLLLDLSISILFQVLFLTLPSRALLEVPFLLTTSMQVFSK